MSNSIVDSLPVDACWQETLQELFELESLIVKLFALSPPPPRSSIERKLILLGDAVELIPTRFPALVVLWNEKVANLKNKFSAISNMVFDDDQAVAKNCISIPKSISSTSMGPTKVVEYGEFGVGVRSPRKFAFIPPKGDPFWERPNESNTLQLVQSNGSPLSDSLPRFLDCLQPELESLENDICKMLSIRPLPVSELEPKLATLGKSIANIPSECRETAKKWNKKFIHLTEKYDRMQSRVQKESATEEISRLPSSVEDIPHLSVSSATLVSSNLFALVLQLKDCESNISMKISNGDYGLAEQLMTDFLKSISSFENLCAAEINLWNDKLADFNRKIANEKARAVLPSTTNVTPSVNNHSASIHADLKEDSPPDSSNSNHYQTSSLEQNLISHETVIMKLLNNQVPSISELDAKLAQFVELISKIPDDNSVLVNRWINKMSVFTAQCAAVSMDDTAVCEEAVPLVRSNSLDDLRLWLGTGDNGSPIETKTPLLSPPLLNI